MSVDGTKRIKMYTDDDGNFKGEALIVYFKKDSVNLAIDMADGYYLRYGGERMSVKEADMSFKRNQDTDVVKSKMGRKEKKDKERTFAEMNR
jgi:HIV Tat-specific factor 1